MYHTANNPEWITKLQQEVDEVRSWTKESRFRRSLIRSSILGNERKRIPRIRWSLAHDSARYGRQREHAHVTCHSGWFRYGHLDSLIWFIKVYFVNREEKRLAKKGKLDLTILILFFQCVKWRTMFNWVLTSSARARQLWPLFTWWIEIPRSSLT